jgi:hypothetical protein
MSRKSVNFIQVAEKSIRPRHYQPHLLGFTVVSNHPKAGELHIYVMWSKVQGSASQHFSHFLVPHRKQNGA